MVHRELERRGFTPGVDFVYQRSLYGGRTERGGRVVDFHFLNLPLAIGVQGEYWHFAKGSAKQAQDRLAKAELAGRGITLIYIDDSDVIKNVRFYVAEALRFRDHSRLRR